MPTRGSPWHLALGTWRHALCLPLLLAASVVFRQESATLEVRVGTAGPKQLTPADLAALPQTEIVEARTVGAEGSAETAQVRWRGVLLRHILDAAGLQELGRRDQRRSAVVARERDGYVVLFSWGELFNAKLGENVLVVTAADSKNLPASEGPYALRSLSDARSGPRHVKWLQQLEVITIPR